eukprot:1160897-Pelagomonas_calceolata.AAC.6
MPPQTVATAPATSQPVPSRQHPHGGTGHAGQQRAAGCCWPWSTHLWQRIRTQSGDMVLNGAKVSAPQASASESRNLN